MPFVEALALLGVATSFPDTEEVWANATVVKNGNFFAEVFVAPNGEILDCEVVYSDFDREQDNNMCWDMKRQKAAAPARDQNGAPVHGTSLIRVSSTYGQDAKDVLISRPPAVEVDAAIPGRAAGAKLEIGLRILVSELGKVGHCEGAYGAPDDLAKAACPLLMGSSQRIRSDKQGKPVRHITWVTAVFHAK